MFGCNRPSDKLVLQGEWLSEKYPISINVKNDSIEFYHSKIITTRDWGYWNNIDLPIWSKQKLKEINSVYKNVKSFEDNPLKLFRIISIELDEIVIDIFNSKLIYSDTLKRATYTKKKYIKRIQLSNNYNCTRVPNFDLEISINGEYKYKGIKYVPNIGEFTGELNSNQVEPLFKVSNEVLEQKFQTGQRWVCRSTSSGEIFRAVFFMENGEQITLKFCDDTVPPAFHTVFKRWKKNVFMLDGVENSGENYIFKSRLAFADDMNDSIRYLATFDSVNYKLPMFEGGDKKFDNLFHSKFNFDLLSKKVKEKTIADLAIQLTLHINETGKATLKRVGPFDKKYLAIFEKESRRILKLLPKWKPALYNGKAVACERRLFMNQRFVKQRKAEKDKLNSKIEKLWKVN